MKIEYISLNEIIIFLFNNKYNLNIHKEENIEKFLRQLFSQLRDYYSINIEGYYEVNIYVDYNYGLVLSLKKQQLDYYDYFKNQVDMKIIIHKEHFLYLIDNYSFNKDIFDIYKLDSNIYLCPKHKISRNDLARLIENSVIIYDSEDIIKHAIKIK